MTKIIGYKLKIENIKNIFKCHLEKKTETQ